MNQHMNEEALRRAMRGEAEPEAKLAVLRHLASCPECAAIGRRLAQDDLQALAGHLAGDSADSDLPSHPDDIRQLLPYLTGRLDAADSEIVSSHLEDCSRCRTRLEVLRAERHRRIRTYAIAASIAVAAALSSVVILTREPASKPPAVASSQTISPLPLPPPTATATTSTAMIPGPESDPEIDPEIDPEWRQLVARAVEQRRLPFPAVLATLSAPADATRGNDGDAVRVRPAGVILGEARPSFSWPAAVGAAYVVFVFDGEREVVQSPLLRRNAWTPATDLPRGRTLAWQVELRQHDATWIIPSPPAPPALFRIITANEQGEIARATALHGDDPLLLAVLYARSGLRGDALEQLRLAAQQGNAGAAQILKAEGR